MSGLKVIECPVCWYRRDTPENLIPPGRVRVGCPRCGLQFVILNAAAASPCEVVNEELNACRFGYPRLMKLVRGRFPGFKVFYRPDSNPLLLAVTTLLLLIALTCLIPSETTIGGITVTPVDLFSELRRPERVPDPPGVDLSKAAPRQNSSPTVNAPGIAAAAAPASTTGRKSSAYPSRPVAKMAEPETSSQTAFLFDYGTKESPLVSFYEALGAAASKDEHLRVAYYGDSMIEGDLVCIDLRALLQAKFAGSGPGLQRIAPVDAPFRISLRQKHSSNWKSSSLMSRGPNRVPFGIAGPAWMSADGSWVSYAANAGEPAFLESSLVYQATSGDRFVEVVTDGNKTQKVMLESGAGIRRTAIPMPKGGSRQLRITFPVAGVVAYGVSLEGGPGVYVDNFPLRGHSGLELARIRPEEFAAFGRLLDYKLVILQFGVNICQPGNKNFNWYSDKMVQVIHSMRKGLPNAKFLLVSVADRAVKRDGKFVTDESIPALVEAQRRAASTCGIAFFDLYRAMGGRNTMAEWSLKGLGAADRIHISRGGGKRFAKLIYRDLLDTGKEQEAGR